MLLSFYANILIGEHWKAIVSIDLGNLLDCIEAQKVEQNYW
jgi:hypothetical protein